MSRNRRRACLVLVALFAALAPLWPAEAGGGPFHLLKDLNPGPYPDGGGITAIVENGAGLYLAVAEGAYGQGQSGELWSSDGMPGGAGTGILRDILPGPQNSAIGCLTVAGPYVFFCASDGSRGNELWITDGGSYSTRLVRDVRPGPEGSSPDSLVAANGILFFTADDGVHGRELWKTDGTAVGTTMVQDIHPGPTGSDPMWLVSFRDGVAFAARDSVNGTELWYSDGTSTSLIANINPGATSSYPSWLVNRDYGGVEALFFAATCDTIAQQFGTELWASTGPGGTTAMVRDIRLGPGSSDPNNLFVLTDSLYFAADDGTAGVELWTSDGTFAGTTMVEDISPGGAGSSPHGFASVGASAFFVADDGAAAIPHGAEVWHTHGNAADTFLVKDVWPGVTGSEPSGLTAYAGSLYFAADDGGGRQLWRHNPDPAPGDTTKLPLPSAAPGGASPRHLTVFPGGGPESRLYFGARDAGGGGLWRTDGTQAGTELVDDFRPWGTDSGISSPVALGSRLFFAAGDGASGQEWWASDGTAAGTTIVRDINTQPGSYGSFPQDAIAFAGAAYFSADDGVNGNELWRSDGTPGGTTMVKDALPGPNGSGPSWPAAYGGWLYFAATDGGWDTELWRSDGIPSGGVTQVFANLDAAGSSDPQSLVAAGGLLYFSAATAGAGRELWLSDGTVPGTTYIDIVPGAGGSDASGLAGSGGIVYFSADDGVHGAELWRSDGTLAGTKMVRDILAGVDGSSPEHLVGVGGVLYFAANDGTHGVELWRSDGTAAGTSLVRDIYPGAIGSQPAGLAAMNGYLVFAASDGGREFAFTSGGHGCEPWMSDGTAGGTHMLQDAISGPAGSNPRAFAMFGRSLFFSADDGVHGQELWSGLPFRQLLPQAARTLTVW